MTAPDDRIPVERDQGPARLLSPAPWGIREVLLAVFLAIGGYAIILVAALVIALLTGGRGPHPGRTLGAGLAATFVFDLFLLGVALFFAVVRYRLTLVAYGFRRFPWSESYLPGAGLLGAYGILAVYVALSFLPHLRHLRPSSNIPPDALKYPYLAIATGVLACTVAPFVEESFFRGFVFRGLLNFQPGSLVARQRLGAAGQFWIAALLSGFLFAASHLQPGLLLPFTGVGALFAWLFWRSGSLWPNIIAHAAFNAISFGLSAVTHR
jgi:membrane protease YdiL (CAAX protease family)